MSNKITSRDEKIISFVKEFRCANTNCIKKLFFNGIKYDYQICERRLKRLVEYGKLKRYRSDILHPYVYYINKKVRNVKHTCLIADVYALFATHYEILNYKRECTLFIENQEARADLVVVIRRDKEIIPIIIEIDLSKPIADKYDEWIRNKEYLNKFPVEPIILSVTNKTHTKSRVAKRVDANNIDEILEVLVQYGIYPNNKV